MNIIGKSFSFLKMFAPNQKSFFHTTPVAMEIRKLTRLRVVDNSKIGKSAMLEGRPPRCIHVYKKTSKKLAVGTTGDLVLVAIKGEKVKGIIVGCVKEQPALIPSFDSNNIVLVDNKGNPLGNRIYAPLPTMLRQKLKRMSHPKKADFTKILSIASTFV